jgi:hypothetical protein
MTDNQDDSLTAPPNEYKLNLTRDEFLMLEDMLFCELREGMHNNPDDNTFHDLWVKVKKLQQNHSIGRPFITNDEWISKLFKMNQ